MLNEVPVQVRQSHEERVYFPFLADRKGNLIADERHHNFKAHNQGHSLVVISGPLQSEEIRHSASGTERRCVRGIIFKIIEICTMICNLFDGPIRKQLHIH